MKLLVKKSTLCYGNKNRNRDFWRDKTPFKKSRENFYENNKEGKLKNLLDNFYYKEDIDLIVNEIEKLLNCG